MGKKIPSKFLQLLILQIILNDIYFIPAKFGTFIYSTSNDLHQKRDFHVKILIFQCPGMFRFVPSDMKIAAITVHHHNPFGILISRPLSTGKYDYYYRFMTYLHSLFLYATFKKSHTQYSSIPIEVKN